MPTFSCENTDCKFYEELDSEIKPLCPECKSLMVEVCPMCGNGIDTDTKYCIKCEEFVG